MALATALLCALCARVNNLSASNFTGWLPNGQRGWTYCGTCGWHLFDNAGNPACGTGEPSRPGEDCPHCAALIHGGGAQS